MEFVSSISELGPTRARSVSDGVKSGSEIKKLLDNLTLIVGVLSSLQAASPPYQVYEKNSFVIFKEAVALTYTTWHDVEETKTTHRRSTIC